MSEGTQASAAADQESPLPAPVPLTQAGVLIAGGTGGVGLATALSFADAGVRRVALMGRDPTRGELALAELARHHPDLQAVFVQGDAVEAAQAEAAVAETERRIGDVDVFVSSVTGGVSTAVMPGPLHTKPIEHILPTVVNQLIPPLHMTRAVIERMRVRRCGVVINIASDAAKVPTPGEAVIGAAMAGIVRFSTTVALEAKRFGVRVNVITPSLIVGTSAHEQLMANEFASKLFAKALKAAHLGATTPEDIAPLIVFLASPDAARITGQVISVNGGISVA